MKIYRSFITPARPVEVDEDVSFRDFDFTPFYPLVGIEACHLSGEICKQNDRYFMTAHISADLLLVDARDNKPFPYPVDLDEYFELLEDELGDEEGYVFPNNLIEPRDIAFAILRGQIPIKPLRSDSMLPKESDGVAYFEEGDEPIHHESPFDGIDID